jgi:hypothetical protein
VPTFVYRGVSQFSRPVPHEEGDIIQSPKLSVLNERTLDIVQNCDVTFASYDI